MKSEKFYYEENAQNFMFVKLEDPALNKFPDVFTDDDNR